MTSEDKASEMITEICTENFNFFSVTTKTTTLSKETWSLCNRATAKSLKEMAEREGPMCCKRNAFTAIRYAAKTVLEEFGCDLSCHEETECAFSKYNLECLEDDCPFYKEDKAGKQNVRNKE